LRVADGFGQHLAELSLRLRRLARGLLPLGHGPYVGMQRRRVVGGILPGICIVILDATFHCAGGQSFGDRGSPRCLATGGAGRSRPARQAVGASRC
jgi:hypothetical protein